MSRQHRFPTALGVPPPSFRPPLWGGFGRGGALCVWAGGRLILVVITVVFVLCLYVLLLLDFREVSLFGLRVLIFNFRVTSGP